MRSTLLAVVAAAIMTVPSLAFASGGGKATSTIKVTNGDTTGGATLAVIVDPPANFNATTPAAFTAAGGKLLSPGETGSFSVKGGTHTIAGAFVSQAGVIGPTNASTVTIGTNQTQKYMATGNATTAPTFTLVP